MCAFPSNQTNQDARWSQMQAVIDALTGVSGGGDQVQLTQYNNSSNYALDVRNLDTTSSYGLRVRDASSNNLLTVAKNAIGIGSSAADVVTVTGRLSAASLTQSPSAGSSGVLVNLGGTLTEAASGTHARLSAVEIAAPTITSGAGSVTDAQTLYISGAPSASGASNWALWIDAGAARLDGATYIGDTANANMALGLTINQGANDNEILAFKSSDIDHGITDAAETDTFGLFTKAHATEGGLWITGLGHTGSEIALRLRGIAVNDDTAKTTAATAAVYIEGGKKNVAAGGAMGADANLVAITNSGTARFLFDAEGTMHSIGATTTDSVGNGLWFLNDTANANMALGLTINQGANDNEILAFKSSDIAHGITDAAETDTYGLFTKAHATEGGLWITGLGHTGSEIALWLRGIAVNDDTAKTTAATAAVYIEGGKKNVTAGGALGANANIMAITNSGTTRFLFDAEGSAHGDVEWIAFDNYDDVALLNQLDAAMTRDSVKTEFGRYLGDYRQQLQAAKIVNFYEPDGPRAMVNFTRLTMLLTGAVRQIGRRLEVAEAQLRALPAGGGGSHATD